MITCREVIEVLLEFVEGGLPSDHQHRVQEHLGGCPECAAYKETYELTIRVTRKLECRPLSAACEQRLRASLQRELGGQGDTFGLV